MFLKQVDMKTALELALKGIEVKTLVPTGPGSGWTSMKPDTLQNMLADVLFFRQEPALEVPMIEEEATGDQIPPPTGLRPCGCRSQTETGRYREAPGTPESWMEYEEDRRRAGNQ